MNYPPADHVRIAEFLQPPNGPCNVIIDTDTYNEIDDQFAIVHAMLTDTLNIEAMYAAPFHNTVRNTRDYADGMEQSYEEIFRVLDKIPVSFDGPVLKGSKERMTDTGKAVDSPAARDLIDKAMAQRDGPLYVLALGAATNVSSAILMEPEITNRIAVVVLGGWPYHVSGFHDFNFVQDIRAAQVLFDCGVPLIQVPGFTVSEALRTTRYEMQEHVQGHGAIGDFLYDNYMEFVPDELGKSKPIWDLAPGAYLLDADWMKTQVIASPSLNEDMSYSFDSSRHAIRVVTWLNRDAIFTDFFDKLHKATGG